jgi:Fe-S cluster biogenesis protein NfuA
MFIQTEQTPNPASLKFLPGCEVMLHGVVDFKSATEAHPSPLAESLFKIAGVSGVFLGHDFITVSKAEETDWQALKPLILGVIMEHFTTGRPVMQNEEAHHLAASTPSENDSDIVRQIKELLDTRIRPAVAADGGDIAFHAFENGVVHLEMRGACAGCPSSTMTLKAGIENLLKHFIPEVNEVRAVNS